MAPQGSLKQRSTSAGGWVVLEMALSHALRLSSNLIMTRLLLPEAFGLIALIGTLHTALTLFSDLGIQRSVVREIDGEDSYFLRAAWTVQIIRGAVISAIVVVVGIALFWVGPLANPETVYAAPELPGLVILSAPVMLMQGLTSTNLWVATRHLKQARILVVNVGGQIVAMIAMIAFAQINPSVWALLAGMLVGNLVKLLLSHVLFEGPRMQLVFDREIADRLWVFGKWVLGSSALTFLANNANKLFLAALLDKETFGFFIIAMLWIQAGVTILTHLGDRIGFSAFSEVLRDRSGQIRRVFRKFIRLADGLATVGFLICFFGGPTIIALLYAPHYQPAGTFMPILSLLILAQRFNIVAMLTLSLGNSRAMALASGARTVAICTLVPIGYHYFDVEGALLATIVARLSGAPILMYSVKDTLKHDIREEMIWLVGILTVIVCYNYFG